MLDYKQRKILIFGICSSIAGLISYFFIQLSGINNQFSNLKFSSIFNFDLEIQDLLILGFNISVLIVLIYLGHNYIDKTKFQLISLLRNILIGFFCVTIGVVVLTIIPITEISKFFFLDENDSIEFTLKHIISVYAIFFALRTDLKFNRIGLASIICGVAAIQYIYIWNFGKSSIIAGYIFNGLTIGVVVAFFNPEFSNYNNKNLLNVFTQRAKKIIDNKAYVESSDR